MTEQYPIIGCTTGVHPRLEIRDLQQQKEQWTLFIHAMAGIQQHEHRPKASRFADLGGIHGLPYERWAGDPASPDKLPVGTWGGYCNHQSVLFPVWHRPYILAIEQSISETAVRLAHRWTRRLDDEKEKAIWTKAAEELRFPFWDWTDERTGKDGVPDVLQPQTFTFTLPGNVESILDNPLASYEFGSRIPDGFANTTWSNSSSSPNKVVSYFEEWNRTYRWPSSKVNPIEDYVKIKQCITGNGAPRASWQQLRNDVANLFTFPAAVEKGEKGRGASIWDEFSNDAKSASKKNMKWKPCNISSLEQPHNMVHLLVGGLGAMANNDYAGFDPIFYLHHANMDRILAFWEYTYNEYWMEDGYIDKNNTLVPFAEKDGTFDVDDNTSIKQTSQLKPFRKGGNGNEYWTPNDTRFLRENASVKKGYTYPPIDGVSLDNPLPVDVEKRREYMGILQKHFGLTAPPSRAPHEGSTMKHPIFTGPIHKGPSTLPLGHMRVDDYRRFTVLVDAVGHAFNGSYYVQLSYQQQVIGSMAVLSRGEATQCSACKTRADDGTRARGFIDIPEDIVLQIVKDGDLNKEKATTDELIANIRSSLTLKMAGPTGVILATALPVSSPKSSAQDNREPGSVLDKSIAPSVKLLSSAAAIPESDSRSTKTPALQYYDWTSHGTLLTGGQEWISA
jgi:tyrosinase